MGGFGDPTPGGQTGPGLAEATGPCPLRGLTGPLLSLGLSLSSCKGPSTLPYWGEGGVTLVQVFFGCRDRGAQLEQEGHSRGGPCLLVITVWGWASLWTSLSFGPPRQLPLVQPVHPGLPPKGSFLSYLQDSSNGLLPLQQSIFLMLHASGERGRRPEPLSKSHRFPRSPQAAWGLWAIGLGSRGPSPPALALGVAARAWLAPPTQHSLPCRSDPGLGQGRTQRPLTGHLR